MKRADILRPARDWLGTPYQHQASLKGIGTDCLGLLRGVWRTHFGDEPEKPPPYTPDWAEALGEETLMQAANRSLKEIPISEAREGDVLLFRMGLGCPAKHCAIISRPGRIIHAYWGHSVVETRLVPWWRRRIAAAYQFPDIED